MLKMKILLVQRAHQTKPLPSLIQAAAALDEQPLHFTSCSHKPAIARMWNGRVLMCFHSCRGETLLVPGCLWMSV